MYVHGSSLKVNDCTVYLECAFRQQKKSPPMAVFTCGGFQTLVDFVHNPSLPSPLMINVFRALPSTLSLTLHEPGDCTSVTPSQGIHGQDSCRQGRDSNRDTIRNRNKTRNRNKVIWFPLGFSSSAAVEGIQPSRTHGRTLWFLQGFPLSTYLRYA